MASDAWVLASIVILGLLHLPYPFSTDQAQDFEIARQMSRGAVLYLDIWDVRQPMIFYFYEAAGRLFGFTEIGLHLFESLYMVLFAVVLLVLLRPRFRSSVVASVVPLFVVGAYYAGVMHAPHLTQVESLVGLPLFCCLWFSTRSASGRWRPFAAGVLGAVCLLFKLMFLPIVLLAWTMPWLIRRLDPDHPRPELRSAVWLAGGAFLVLAGYVVLIASQGALGVVAWTFFVFPPRAISIVDQPFMKFVRPNLWFGGCYASLILLAAVRLRGHAWRRDPLDLGLVGWIALAIPLTVIQMWWSYHWYLFLVPFGVLAAEGLDDLLAGEGSLPRRATLAVALCFALPLAGVLVFKVYHLARFGFAIDPQQRERYRIDSWKPYRISSLNAAFLEDRATRPGPIYVIGDALVMPLAHRAQAIPLIGSSPEMLPPSTWREMVRELRKATPPYVFVQDGWQMLIDRNSREMRAFLDGHYRVLGRTAQGTWYEELHPQPAEPVRFSPH